MKSRRFLAGVAGLTISVMGIALVSACGSDTPNNSTTGGDAPAASSGSEPNGAGQSDTPSEGKTLIVESSFDVTTPDPGRVFEITGGMIIHSIYEPLLTFEGSDVANPIPLLAKSYEMSEDGTTLTLPLRDDVTFSDGSKMDSSDVVFTFNRVKNLKGNPSFILDGVTATAPDPGTVVLTSDKPNPALPYLLTNPALGIENAEVFQQNGGTDAEDADQSDTAESWLQANSAGSGPYLLDSFSTTTEVVLTANEHYWQGTTPAYTKVVLRNVTADVQKLDVQKNAAQLVLDLAPTQAVGLSGDVTVHSDPTSNTWFVFSNDNPEVSPITSNKDFQTAIRYGLDYDSLVKLAGEGSVQAPGIIPTLFIGALPPEKAIQRDLDAAKEALAKSGYKNEPVELEFPSDFTKNGLSFETIAQRIQQQLQEVGINVVLNPAPIATSLPRYRDGIEQLGFWLWGADYPDPSDYLEFLPGHTVGLRAGWAAGADDALSALGEQAAVETDNDKRAQLFEQIQERMNEQSPFIPMFQSAQVAVTAPSLEGFAYNSVWTVEFSALK